MESTALLMSIRPRHADKIFAGMKTVELRRTRPRALQEGSLVFVYVSAPVKSLVGAFRVATIVEDTVPALWRIVKDHACVSRADYLNYFSASERGVAIFIQRVWRLARPIHLAELQEHSSVFTPPQSFQYTSIRQMGILQ